VITISVPPEMLDELERVRKEEHRTRSELMREALRVYFSSRIPEDTPAAAELRAIRRGRAAIARGDYVTLDFLGWPEGANCRSGPVRVNRRGITPYQSPFGGRCGVGMAPPIFKADSRSSKMHIEFGIGRGDHSRARGCLLSPRYAMIE
jgi:predicted transcriptional regulator